MPENPIQNAAKAHNCACSGDGIHVFRQGLVDVHRALGVDVIDCTLQSATRPEYKITHGVKFEQNAQDDFNAWGLVLTCFKCACCHIEANILV